MNIPFADLQTMLQGEVLTTFPDEYSCDAGGYLQGKPLAVVKARSEEDILQTFRFAADYQLPVAIRGGGFSMNGRTIIEGGILLVNYSDTPDYILQENGMVEVSTRTNWQSLETALNAQGYTAPVLTYFLHPSIGGTLSAGGYGMRSIQLGGQVDHIQRLKLITPDGNIWWCSPTENPELFRFALAGQGQIGIIEKASFPSLKDRCYSIHFHYNHETLTEMAKSLEWLCEEDPPDTVAIFGNYPSGKIEAIFGYERPSKKMAIFTAPPKPLRTQEVSMVEIYPWYHLRVHAESAGSLQTHSQKLRLWTDLGVQYEAFVELMAFVEKHCLNSYLNMILILPVRVLPHHMNLPFAAHHQETDLVFGFGVYYLVPPDDVAGIELVKYTLQTLQEKTYALGGRPYLYGYHALNEEQKQSIYGADYQKLKHLKQQLDPHNLLRTI